MAQVAERLPIKYKALNSNHTTIKEKNKFMLIDRVIPLLEIINRGKKKATSRISAI
jgi:hypothetical protein